MLVLAGSTFLRDQGLWDQAGGVFSCADVPGWDRVSLVRDQAGGVLSSAAVPRAGLGPATPCMLKSREFK